ncbi:myelin expression factor 2-like isoform X2 [Anneissia japonica]|uniref:myelin expression factor 2-like isoform X1 n=1 Tax=Anneissia japonica TaxID=1529436 RepID=UPI001425B26C|nr:myelin expression factor 2-like isoform X1 [Anneissia japonica]XP_033108759.1 myelin expression factor 2-like isoform X2 [Anneissia japonica]
MADEIATVNKTEMEADAPKDDAPAPQPGGRYRSRSRSPTRSSEQNKPRRENDRGKVDRNRDRDRNRGRDRDRDRRGRMGDRRVGMGQGGRERGAGPREAILERSVFVSNIPYELKWQDLKDTMRKNVGEVTYVEIFTDDDGKSRGCALVEFADRTDVGKACDKMHRYEIEGRSIVVKEDRDGRISRKYRPRVQDEKAQMMLTPQVLQQLNLDPDCVSDTVFVSNLPYQVTWRKLKDIFKMAGEVVHADILEDEKRESRGLATVQFESPLGAVQAISMFNGQSLYDRVMRVRMDKVKAQEDMRERNRKILPSGLGGLGPTLDMLGPSSGGGGMGMGGNVGGGRGMGGGAMGGGAMGGFNLGGMGGNMGMGVGGGQGMGGGGGGMGMGSGGGSGLGLGSGGLGLGGNSGMGGLSGNLGLGIGGGLSGGMGSLGGSLGNTGLGSMNNMGLGGGGGGGGNFGNGLNSGSGLGSSFGSGGGGGGGYGGSSNLGSSAMGGIGGGSIGLSNSGMGYSSNMNSDLGMGLSGGRSDFPSIGGNNSSILGEPRGNLRDSGRPMFREGSCQILVRNLPFSYDWKKLKDSFRHIAPVVYAEVRTENGRSKGYGLVKFEVPEDAQKAVQEMNRVRLDGREIYVQIDN